MPKNDVSEILRKGDEYRTERRQSTLTGEGVVGTGASLPVTSSGTYSNNNNNNNNEEGGAGVGGLINLKSPGGSSPGVSAGGGGGQEAISPIHSNKATPLSRSLRRGSTRNTSSPVTGSLERRKSNVTAEALAIAAAQAEAEHEKKMKEQEELERKKKESGESTFTTPSSGNSSDNDNDHHHHHPHRPSATASSENQQQGSGVFSGDNEEVEANFAHSRIRAGEQNKSNNNNTNTSGSSGSRRGSVSVTVGGIPVLPGDDESSGSTASTGGGGGRSVTSPPPRSTEEDLAQPDGLQEDKEQQENENEEEVPQLQFENVEKQHNNQTQGEEESKQMSANELEQFLGIDENSSFTSNNDSSRKQLKSPSMQTVKNVSLTGKTLPESLLAPPPSASSSGDNKKGGGVTFVTPSSAATAAAGGGGGGGGGGSEVPLFKLYNLQLARDAVIEDLEEEPVTSEQEALLLLEASRTSIGTKNSNNDNNNNDGNNRRNSSGTEGGGGGGGDNKKNKDNKNNNNKKSAGGKSDDHHDEGACSCCFCCCGKRGSEYETEFRDVPVLTSFQEQDVRANKSIPTFAPNQIFTNRYSLRPWRLDFFLTRMLWEQFHRIANIYFLIISVLQMIPGISPTGQFTTLMTLVLVLLFSFIKLGIEDINRYRRDCQTNDRPVYVLKSFNDKEWKRVTYADIEVGDLVRVENVDHSRSSVAGGSSGATRRRKRGGAATTATSGESGGDNDGLAGGEKNKESGGGESKLALTNEVPCDMIILTTADPDGTCYVETSNLDGETNFKQRRALKSTCVPPKVGQEAPGLLDALSGLSATCEHPNGALYKFTANVTTNRRPGLMGASLSGTDPRELLAQAAALTSANGSGKLSASMRRYSDGYDGGVDLGNASATTHPFLANSGNSDRLAPALANANNNSASNVSNNNNNNNNNSGAFPSPSASSPAQQQQQQKPISPKPKEKYSITAGLQHTLYRGSYLRKVQWVVGLCVFTGHETKIMKNARTSTHKVSRVEKMVNSLLLYVLIVLLILCVVCTIGSVVSPFAYWYLNESESQHNTESAKAFLTFLILFNNFIPISLYVSIEFIKFAQGWLMEQDLCIYYEPKDMPAQAKTTDLNEELGQINFVFSDKTGTLTRNVMSLLKFAVAGTVFGQGTTEIGRAAAARKGMKLKDPRPDYIIHGADPFWDSRLQPDKWFLDDKAAEIRELFFCLGVCHTVVVDGQSLEAESPDDEALVKAAAKFDNELVERTSDGVSLQARTGMMQFVPVLDTIDFTPLRKRMSVVVLNPHTSKYMVVMKGADAVVLPRLTDSQRIIDKNQTLLDRFAEEGLRTFVVASRVLDDDFAVEWLEDVRVAREMIGRDEERDAKLTALADQVERNLTLVGIAGIEDKLQEKVPETIEAMRRAGISVWMLTGDKRETAINIGFACALLHTDMDVIQLYAGGVAKNLKEKKTVVEMRQKVKDQILAAIEKAKAIEKAEKEKGDNNNNNDNPTAAAAAAGGGGGGGNEFKYETTGKKKSSSSSTSKKQQEEDEEMKETDSLGSGASGGSNNSLKKHGTSPSRRRQSVVVSPGSPSHPLNKDSDVASNLSHRTVQGNLAGSFGTSFATTVVGMGGSGREIACVIDGNTLSIVLSSRELKSHFYELAKRCSSVICNRVSPKQKADVVELMRNFSDDSLTTLAIGDGANDVPMIQAAHVGVGISGMEGQQAANSADFAIGQFKHLHRLVMVHGRANYVRLTSVIIYSFYKNILLVMTQFWYCLFNLFTGQSLYEQWGLALYNVAFTFLPIIFVGILDREILNTDNIHIFPQLYVAGIECAHLNIPLFLRWVFVAFIQSIIAFFVMYYGMSAFSSTINLEGQPNSLDGLGLTTYFGVILIATFQLCLVINSFTHVHYAMIGLSLFAVLLFLVIYPVINPTFTTSMYGTLRNVVFDSLFWLIAFVGVVGALLPSILGKYFAVSMRSVAQLPISQLVQFVDASDPDSSLLEPLELEDLSRKNSSSKNKRRNSDESNESDSNNNNNKDKDREEDEDSLLEAGGAALEKLRNNLAFLVAGTAWKQERVFDTSQSWYLGFRDGELEDTFHEKYLGPMVRYRVGFGICTIAALVVTVYSAVDSVTEPVEIAGWSVFAVTSFAGFLIVTCNPGIRDYLNEVMFLLMVVAFSGASIANLAATQRDPLIHPVTLATILLGLLVLVRPMLAHSILYVLTTFLVYFAWSGTFSPPSWKVDGGGRFAFMRAVELAVVGFTSLVGLAVIENFERKIFKAQVKISQALVRGKKEQNRSILLLQNIMPSSIAFADLKSKNLSSFNVSFDSASVVTSDIVKITHLGGGGGGGKGGGDNNNPNSNQAGGGGDNTHFMIEMLNVMFTMFDQHSSELGIEKIKSVGDQYMCAAGIPVPDKEHAKKVVIMGLKMLRSVAQMNRQGASSTSGKKVQLSIRVGAATGKLQAGVVGRQKLSYDVFGPAVDEAQQMEVTSKPNRLQVSHDIYEMTYDVFEYRSLEDQQGKERFFVIDDFRDEEWMTGWSALKFVPAPMTRKSQAQGTGGGGGRGAGEAGSTPSILIGSGGGDQRSSSHTGSEPSSGKLNNNNNKQNRLGESQSEKSNTAGDGKSRTTTHTTSQNHQHQQKEKRKKFHDSSQQYNFLSGAAVAADNNSNADGNEREQNLDVYREENADEFTPWTLEFESAAIEEDFRLYLSTVADSRTKPERVQAFIMFILCAILIFIVVFKIHWLAVITGVCAIFCLVSIAILYKEVSMLEVIVEETGGVEAVIAQREAGVGGDVLIVPTSSPKNNNNNNNPNKSSREQSGALIPPSSTNNAPAANNAPATSSSSPRVKGVEAAAIEAASRKKAEREKQKQQLKQQQQQQDQDQQQPQSQQKKKSAAKKKKQQAENELEGICGDCLSFHNTLLLLSCLIGLAALVVPVVFVLAVNTSQDAGTVSVFVSLAAIVNVVGSVRLRLWIKIAITVLHFIIYAACFFVSARKSDDGFTAGKDGGNLGALAICYLVAIVAGYQTERSVRKNFVITMMEHIESRQVQSAIALCERLLTNTLPLPIIRRMRKDPSKRIVDEIEDASVLFVYLVGQRDEVGDDEMFFEEDEMLALDYHEIVDEINEFVFIVDMLCQYHGLEKMKNVPFIIAAGVPEPVELHYLRLACFARDLMAFADFYNSRMRQGSGVCVKAGMHCGRVTAGVMGTTKFSYDVFGDTVNLSSDIANAVTAGTVQCSRAMFQRLKPHMSLAVNPEPIRLRKQQGATTASAPPTTPTAATSAASSVSSPHSGQLEGGINSNSSFGSAAGGGIVNANAAATAAAGGGGGGSQNTSFSGGTNSIQSTPTQKALTLLQKQAVDQNSTTVYKLDLSSVPLEVPTWLWEEATTADEAYQMVCYAPDPYPELIAKAKAAEVSATAEGSSGNTSFALNKTPSGAGENSSGGSGLPLPVAGAGGGGGSQGSHHNSGQSSLQGSFASAGSAKESKEAAASVAEAAAAAVAAASGGGGSSEK